MIALAVAFVCLMAIGFILIAWGYYLRQREAEAHEAEHWNIMRSSEDRIRRGLAGAAARKYRKRR